MQKLLFVSALLTARQVLDEIEGRTARRQAAKTAAPRVSFIFDLLTQKKEAQPMAA